MDQTLNLPIQNHNVHRLVIFEEVPVWYVEESSSELYKGVEGLFSGGETRELIEPTRK